ncbi:MAG: BREX-6 system adenine-specific DNA-methyltransferase PglX, partial [Cyanobacteria bacterium J06555_13]
MTYLTPEAKAKLATTIRGLRATKENANGGLLLKGLREAAESTYRLSIGSLKKAELAEEPREKRQRLETWLKEQVRADLSKQQAAGKSLKDKPRAEAESRERHLQEAIKLAGATLLNRLVVIKQLEAQEIIKPAVVTGGWNSSGYRELREFAPALCNDETEGYGFLLQLLYDELALELPGLFGTVGLTVLFPVPASTLRGVVEALNDPALESAWMDDTTLGWVYQYWNDPEREALDDKLNKGGKVAPHEIASKTQMFTERYMVEWLLQNSLGQQWLAICEKNGWTPEVVADGTLARLEERRADWREKREKGEVALDALMPIEGEAESRWKYWVRQPALGSEGVPQSIRAIKIFDPACGSGHFLVIAFDLLFSFYAEEARHRGEAGEGKWEDKEIVESILENNLFGLDIDPRAVQIAAAALYLKGKGVCRGASPRALNLVASNLNLAAFSVDDPAREELRVAVQQETGIPGALTDEIVEALKGADAWGSLLQVDKAVDKAIARYEQSAEKLIQESLLRDEADVTVRASSAIEKSSQTKAALLSQLEGFLMRRTRSDDLGLRLRGEQLAAGVRFIRMVRSSDYDLVVGNPPYQGINKLKESGYIEKHYKNSKDDLYSAFLERGLQLVKHQGFSALITMRNWLFIKQYAKIREQLVGAYDLLLLGDLETGAFEEVSAAQVVLSVTMSIFRKTAPGFSERIALQPTPGDLKSEGNIARKKAALSAQSGLFRFQANRFNIIKEKPIIYWWSKDLLDRYSQTKTLEEVSPAKFGLTTGNNSRFTRMCFELPEKTRFRKSHEDCAPSRLTHWVPFVFGAKGREWMEPLIETLSWKYFGLEVKVKAETQY